MEFDARLTGMRTAVCMLALAAGVMAIAQVPAASRTFTNPLGFSYSIPSDWEVGDASSAQEAAKQKANEDATSPEEKKGLACVEVGLTARHEGSVIVEVALPFDCYGRSFTDAELPGFGEGVAEGIKSTFNVNEPQTSTCARPPSAVDRACHRDPQECAGPALHHRDFLQPAEEGCGMLDGDGSRRHRARCFRAWRGDARGRPARGAGAGRSVRSQAIVS